MEDFVTDAINIKTYPLSEHDNIVLMLSKQGVIRGVAKGAKLPKSKLGARMQVLVANKLMLHKGRNLDTIRQAQTINTFNKLRQDFDKLTYSIYLAELVGVFCNENTSLEENPEEIYNIFYTTLDKISNSNTKTQIILNVLKFQLKFMQIIGYGIEFENCLICGNKIEKDPIFSIEDGGVICSKCEHQILRKTKIPTKIQGFLTSILNTSLSEKTKYDDLVTEKICQNCFNLLKKYIERQSPKRIKSLDILEDKVS